MTASVHFHAVPRAKMKKPLMLHQVRLTKKEAEIVKKNTESRIEPELTHLNENFENDPDRFKKMRKKADEISEIRVKNGGRKLYKSANILMVGTLQLSDDTLKKMGWKFKNEEGVPEEEQEKLNASYQDPKVLEEVRNVYHDLYESVKSQPEIYGEVFSATLHMDEGTPHVDFMTDPLDLNKPKQTAGTLMNGPKPPKNAPKDPNRKRGDYLRRMQDNLTKNMNLDKSLIDKYEIKRGFDTTEKKDMILYAKRMKDKADADAEKAEKMKVNAKKIEDDAKASAEYMKNEASKLQSQLLDGATKKRKELDDREKELDSRETVVSGREFNADRKEEDNETKSQWIIKQIKANNSLLDKIKAQANAISGMVDKVEKLGETMKDRGNRQIQRFKDLLESHKPKEAEKVQEAHDYDVDRLADVVATASTPAERAKALLAQLNLKPISTSETEKPSNETQTVAENEKVVEKVQQNAEQAENIDSKVEKADTEAKDKDKKDELETQIKALELFGNLSNVDNLDDGNDLQQ